ncbi:phage holin family protein [Deinococcus navajonensis]|uniref:Phage holin family protein n=1 Tax=Deinococcus navajonensis TaxID=309884 RepID=A0ABV8XN04_9DEIO
MEERKSMGSALVDVFDAGMTLVKSEIRNVGRKVGDTAKAKGLGVVMLLAATGPLIMGLIFLILTIFYGLMALGLPAWAAALIIALVSLAVTGALVMLGLKKLSAEVPNDEPLMYRDPDTLTEDERLEAQYQAEQHAKQEKARQEAAAPSSADMGVRTTVSSTTVSAAPVVSGTTTYGVSADHSGVQGVPVESGGVQGRASGIAVGPEGAVVPVFESTPGGQPQIYGSNLNKKLQDDHGAHDPNVHHPVALKDQPGITVSTEPTFKDDMKKEGY